MRAKNFICWTIFKYNVKAFIRSFKPLFFDSGSVKKVNIGLVLVSIGTNKNCVFLVFSSVSSDFFLNFLITFICVKIFCSIHTPQMTNWSGDEKKEERLWNATYATYGPGFCSDNDNMTFVVDILFSFRMKPWLNYILVALATHTCV